jgi:hypothetical protein
MGSPAERATAISSTAQDVARRIYRFIHPQQHTVDLDELRDPSLLESLAELRRMTHDFEIALGKD